MKRHHLAWILICMLVTLCLPCLAQAQSGRRAKGKATSTNPAPPPTEGASPKSPASPVRQRLSLIVTSDGSDFHTAGIIGRPTGTIMNSFLERLKASHAFTIKVEKEMDREKASDFAKEQVEAYLVWLHFDEEMVSSRRNSPDLYVEYVIFTPGTAKTKGQGRVYMRTYRPSMDNGVPTGVPFPMPRPKTPGSGTLAEASLQQAGYDAADFVIKTLESVAP